MTPISALEKVLRSTCTFPLYINKAAHTENKIERIKLVITACMANFHYNQVKIKFLLIFNIFLQKNIIFHEYFR